MDVYPTIGSSLWEQLPPDAGPDYFERGGVMWCEPELVDRPDDEPGKIECFKVVRMYRGAPYFDLLYEPASCYPSLRPLTDATPSKLVVRDLVVGLAATAGRGGAGHPLSTDARMALGALVHLAPVALAIDR